MPKQTSNSVSARPACVFAEPFRFVSAKYTVQDLQNGGSTLGYWFSLLLQQEAGVRFPDIPFVRILGL